ncbi:MAG: cytochrome P450 [Rhodococcus sp. (in: high G+C Gram-positive bacteria)]|uniref:cytochrome P450 n=1 Tax=Rhodococcus sp. EPR-157 TaxID=1813677 RepID=UPI000AECEB43|nr:cytochrome P450 [Rhodococcus sp. EPR-157]
MTATPTIPTDAGNGPVFDEANAQYRGAARHEYLATLREGPVPIAWDLFGRAHLLRYHDVRSVFLDPEGAVNVGAGLAIALGATSGPLFDWQSHALIVQNPPRHTAMRGAIRSINARLARRLAPLIEEQTHRLVDEFPSDGVVDLVHAFCFTLPVRVIMGLLGLPESDEAQIGEWSPRALPSRPEGVPDADRVNALFREYAEARIEERRAAPRDDDLLTDLIHAQDRGDITPDELWATVQTLVLAGHETTSGALATGVHAMLTHDNQWEQLKSDPSLADGAAEEMLRWDAAAPEMGRVLTRDWEIGGRILHAGTVVALNLTSANRDPRVFERPDEFDIRRSNSKEHLSFGVGIHRCTGAPVAQVEMPIALRVLAERLDHLSLAEEPSYDPGFFRQFDSLRVHVRTNPRRAR